MAEINPGGQSSNEGAVMVSPDVAVAAEVEEGRGYVAEIWDHPDYMDWRAQGLSLDRDRDYPRFSTRYYRRRWHWEAGEQEGNTAFAVTALFAALKANRAQRPSSLTLLKDTMRANRSTD